MEKQDYRVRADGEVAGRWRKAGTVLSLTREEAMFLAPPYGGVLELVKEESATASTTADEVEDAPEVQPAAPTDPEPEPEKRRGRLGRD